MYYIKTTNQNNSNPCLFEQYGIKIKKVLDIPLEDENGIPLNKLMRVTVGSPLHTKLLNIGVIKTK